MRYLAGLDIGGTKCAVSLGKESHTGIELIKKHKFLTPDSPTEVIKGLTESLKELLIEHPQVSLSGIGISCGGPLNTKRGIVICPPNLPGWENIDIVSPFREVFQTPVALENDANACALAEWKWGAGKGAENMVFLTFGTGMGAGLILNGRLYSGSSDMAGEVGHIRLAESGPIGYGKKGSFEGFCSGGGIARYAAEIIQRNISAGGTTRILNKGQDPYTVTAEQIGIAAENGDEMAIDIFREIGEKLGEGLAILIDILNPEKIVIGSIFLRQEPLLRKAMENKIREETLPWNADVCEIVPAGLGELLGDYAALSVAACIAE